MFQFKDGVLRILKMEIPDTLEVEHDLLKNQKDSYNKYRTETIKEDLDYLCEQMTSLVKDSVIGYQLIEKPKYASRPNNETKKKGNEYYPICVRFTRDGEPCTPEVTVIQIPYMDDFCVLNVDGKMKVLLSEMQPLEDVSFEINDKEDETTLMAALPNSRKITFVKRANNVFMKYGDQKPDIPLLILSMYRDIGQEVDLNSIFYNSVLRRAQLSIAKKDIDFAIDDFNTKYGIVEKLKTRKYKLGRLRKMLNYRLTIDGCIGQTLYDPIELKRSGRVLDEGTVVTKDILRELKYNCINTVIVKARPNIEGAILAEPTFITLIKKGTKLNDFLKSYLPSEMQNYSYCPYDTAVELYIDEGTVLTGAIIDTLYVCGTREVVVKFTKSTKNTVVIPFAREICGNYTVQLKDLILDSIPEHLNGDMYHYFYGQEKPWEITDVVEPEYLTVHDVIALVSLLTRAADDPTIPEVADRDADFLKKINRINETFSESFRVAADTFVNTYKRKIKEVLYGRNPDNLFYAVHKLWINDMMIRKALLAPMKDVNPIALLSQINRVVTYVKSMDSVSDEQRTLAKPYYGKICPYETPAGEKIGLTNTLAIGCQVIDGIPHTPYRRLYGPPNNRRVSNRVEYLDTIRESEYRIGDILDLKFDERGAIINTKTIARVKAHGSVEKTAIEVVDSVTLDYVNALPEQHCSPTAMLMPFAAANDGVRVSYGLNLIRQAIYVQKSEIPYVITSMYKDLFKYSDSYCTRALDSGIITDVSCNALSIKYDNEPTETVHQLMETRVSNESVISMTYRAYPGMRVEKGDVLIDSAISRKGYFSPGVNVIAVIMPSAGYNYEDAIDISEHASHKFISICNDVVRRELRRDSTELTHMASDNTYQFIPKGGVIAEVKYTKAEDTRTSRREAITTHKESGILYDCRIERDQDKKQHLVASILGFKHLEAGDKMSGRHGNKGVTSRMQKTSKMPTFLNGIPADVILNPCGIVSRMNMGQQLEGHLGFVAYMLGINIESDPFNGATLSDVKDLMQFVYDLAHMESIEAVQAKWRNKFPEELYEYARRNYKVIKEWEGCFFPDGSAPMWNPETGELFENPITFGMPYFLKINQEVWHKIHARGGMLEEDYGSIDKQPPKGSASGGGQRCGEMEMAALMAHGAANMVWEISNSKSDNIEARTNLTMEALSRDHIYPEPGSPVSVDIWRYYTEVLGAKVEAPELSPIDDASVKARRVYDPRFIIRDQNKIYHTKENKITSESLIEEWDTMDVD